MSESTNLFFFTRFKIHFFFSHFFFEILIEVFHWCDASLYYKQNFHKAKDCLSSSRFQLTSIEFRIVSDEKFWYLLLSVETWSTENSKTLIRMWCFLSFQRNCLQNHKLDFFQQNLGGQFCLCIRLSNKNNFPKDVPCALIGGNWQKCDLWWPFL